MTDVVKVIANNPASILIVAGLFFIFIGKGFGWLIVGIGIILHLVWLFKK